MVRQMKNKIQTIAMALTGCILAGCTCYSTHVPGRHINHGQNPGGIDMFFCNLDYILFPPEQGYVVAEPAPVVVAQQPVVVTAPAVVIPEYGYDWWKGTWVPRYQDWYWYHGTWEWGGRGYRPVPPAWAPDFNRRPLPPPPQPAPAAVVPVAPAPAPIVIIDNKHDHRSKPGYHPPKNRKPTSPARPATVSKPARPKDGSRPARPSTVSRPARSQIGTAPARPSTVSRPARSQIGTAPARPSTVFRANTGTLRSTGR